MQSAKFSEPMIEMNDDTASYIANCYAATKADYSTWFEGAVIDLVILRVMVGMGWTIAGADIGRALQYCATYPLPPK